MTQERKGRVILWMLVLSWSAPVSLAVAGPLTDSIHAETSDRRSTRHSALHAELSRGRLDAAAGSTRLSVTRCRSPTRAPSRGGDIWIRRPVGKQRNMSIFRGWPGGGGSIPPLFLSLFDIQTCTHTHTNCLSIPHPPPTHTHTLLPLSPKHKTRRSLPMTKRGRRRKERESSNHLINIQTSSCTSGVTDIKKAFIPPAVSKEGIEL